MPQYQLQRYFVEKNPENVENNDATDLDTETCSKTPLKRVHESDTDSSSVTTPTANSCTKKPRAKKVRVRSASEEIRHEERLKQKAEEKAEREREKAEAEAERKRIKEEKERQKEQERKEKEHQKESERKQKELEKQMKEEKRKEQEAERQRIKELKEQEREAKQRQKDEEKLERQRKIDAKAEEKKRKDDEKQQQEMEKNRIEEQKRQKEERQKDFLRKFIVKKDVKSLQRPSLGGNTRFGPFELKEGMFVAPMKRREPLPQSAIVSFDTLYEAQSADNKELYVNLLKTGDHIACHSGKSADLVDADIEILEDTKYKMKAKLFQFHDNYRPPYYGTWRKRSKRITGRHPFSKDSQSFDYEVDSDEEWEDEPDGDECVSDDDEEKEEGKEDGEEEDGWMVDHGYLSEGEGVSDEEQDDDPETRRARMIAKNEAWKAETCSKKWKKLQPLVIGPAWPDLPIDPPLMDKLACFKVTVLCQGLVPNSYNIASLLPEKSKKGQNVNILVKQNA